MPAAEALRGMLRHHRRLHVLVRAASAAALTATLPTAVSAFCSSGGACGSRALGFRVDFVGHKGSHTPIYESSPAANTASVNAGDFNLYVGGGAINRAFCSVLGLEDENAYQQLHRTELEAALASPGSLVAAVASPDSAAAMREVGLVASFARVPGHGKARGPVSSVFIDVFQESRRPLSGKNVAMVYVVGPKGAGAPGGHGPTIEGREEFLSAVEDMASNSMLAVREYNAMATTATKALPPIQIVQFCLVSGGVYRHPQTTKLDVAMAIVRGLGQGSGEHRDLAPPPTIRFAYDEGVFEAALKHLHGVV